MISCFLQVSFKQQREDPGHEFYPKKIHMAFPRKMSNGGPSVMGSKKMRGTIFLVDCYNPITVLPRNLCRI